jgi:hypothetical protein
MTEFFDHLVSRSHVSHGEESAGGVLRPRLPSLFEAPAGAASAPAAPFETEHDASGDSSQPDAAAVESRGRLPLQVDAGSRLTQGPALDDRINQETYSEPKTGRFQAGFKNGPPERRIGDAGLLRAREPGNAAVRPENVQPLPAPEMGEQFGGPAAERGNAEGSGGQAEGPDGRGARVPRPEPIRPAPLPAPAGPFNAAQVRRPVPLASDPPEAGFQVPTVHISVGRIEVRAVSQPAQPPARTPSTPRPKLSLDEYLRQRNEGKR